MSVSAIGMIVRYFDKERKLQCVESGTFPLTYVLNSAVISLSTKSDQNSFTVVRKFNPKTFFDILMYTYIYS